MEQLINKIEVVITIAAAVLMSLMATAHTFMFFLTSATNGFGVIVEWFLALLVTGVANDRYKEYKKLKDKTNEKTNKGGVL